ncbi:hypothetical protein ACFQGW_07725 [Xanthomonas theicola]|uniref:hypothetical protein n=1 Tax=Xanthomonas theicola TaxID=56464 RepID=UPI00361A7653
MVLPHAFGPARAPYRTLAEQDFFGRYLRGHRLCADTADELAARRPAAGLGARLVVRAQAAAGGGVALLAWGVHDLDQATVLQLAQDLARLPGMAPTASWYRRCCAGAAAAWAGARSPTGSCSWPHRRAAPGRRPTWGCPPPWRGCRRWARAGW